MAGSKKRETPVGRSSTAFIGRALRNSSGLNRNQTSIINDLLSKGEEYEVERIVLDRLRSTYPSRKKDFEKWSREYNSRVTKNNRLGNEIAELQDKFAATINRSNRSDLSRGIDILRSTRDAAQSRAAKVLENVYIPKDRLIP